MPFQPHGSGVQTKMKNSPSARLAADDDTVDRRRATR
jgi:hypothetical protein